MNVTHSCQIYLKYLIYISSSRNVDEVQAQQKRKMIKFPAYLAAGGGLFFLYGSLLGQHLAGGLVGSGGGGSWSQRCVFWCPSSRLQDRTVRLIAAAPQWRRRSFKETRKAPGKIHLDISSPPPGICITEKESLSYLLIAFPFPFSRGWEEG